MPAGPSTPVRGSDSANPLASPRAAGGGTPGMAAAQSGLMAELASVQQALRRKEEQVARLARERAASGVKAQYDRLVADMARQQAALKEQQQALRAKLKAVDVRAPPALLNALSNYPLVIWRTSCPRRLWRSR